MTRNLAPSVLSALPHVHPIAAYETAFNARRDQLVRQTETELVLGRIAALLRWATGILVDVEIYCLAPDVVLPVEQPTIRWRGQLRTQPRDGKGRLLSKAWLNRAEQFSAADLAWFRGR